MATFTISTNKNFTELTGKNGGDTYNVSAQGVTLTIDSDMRYAPNCTATTGVPNNISLSATLGGNLLISGTNIFQMKISGGTGNIPASGTIITQGSVTAELLVVMSTQAGGTIAAAGTAWSGLAGYWIKVRNITGGSLTTGAATLAGGSTITISVAPVVSWIECVGVESMAITVNRLNKLTMQGDWWYVLDANGAQVTTTGVRGEAYQLPAFTASVVTEYGGVEIETAPGSGVYEHWVNTSYKFSSTNHATDARAKFCRISSGGLLTLGQDSGGNSAGFMPVAGCRIRVPNIVTCSANFTAGLGVNVTPSATMGTRYEIAANQSGIVDIRIVGGSWYFNIQQAYSVYIRNLHTCEQFVLAETSLPADIDGLMVGMSNQASPYASNAIVFQQCMNGGTAKNMTCVRAEQISTAGYACYFVNLYGGWTIDNVKSCFASTATALAGPIFFNTCDNLTVSNLYLVGKRLIMSACSNWTVTNVYYCDNPVGTQANTVATQAVELMANCRSGTLTNVANYPGTTDTHAISGLVYMNTCSDILVTGIGSSASPYQGGSTAGFRTGYMFADGGLNKNIKFQRNWMTNLRLGLASSTNTTQNIRMQNCYNTDASLTQGPNWYNSLVRGNRQNSGSAPTSYIHVDGMHFYDCFTGDTTTRVFLCYTEKSLSTASAYTIDSGTPRFTSTGSIVMQAVGDQVTWTQSYFMLGWTGLSNFAITGTNATTNHTHYYDIDKGTGFTGTFKALSVANLTAETGISPTVGVRFKFRTVCTTASTGNVLTSFYVSGTTTLAAQNAALYPVDTIGLTISGIQPGSDVVVYQAGTTTVLDVGDAVATSSYTYQYSMIQNIDIGIILSGYVPYFIRNYALTSTPTTLPVAQIVDRAYKP